MWSTTVIALLIWNAIAVSEVSADSADSWNGWSPHDNNDRYRREPLPVILPATKTQFKQLWYTKLNGPVLVTPTVYRNRLYVSTFSGTFYCLQADNGNILWQKSFSSIMNNGYNYFSRSSPLIYKDLIILGIMETALIKAVPGHGSYIIALDCSTGVLRWKTLVSSHPASTITTTPQLANDRLFIGISSGEEAFAANLSYPCCTFQGSVVALQATNGKFLWETKMVPDNNGSINGYSGKFKKKINWFFAIH